MAKHPVKRTVALILNASEAAARAALRGTTRYARNQGPWKLLASIHGGPWPAAWDGLHIDGFIGLLASDTYDQPIHKLGVPAVNISTTRARQPFPHVCTDNVAVGALAARDFLDRGFHRFAYFADPRPAWAATRGQGFIQTLAAEGYDCDVFRPDTQDPDREPLAGMHAWIDRFVPPIAVFCGNEHLGWTLVGTCHDRGFDVPEQVAVIVGSDDDLVCEAADVPLSAIDIGNERVGYAAAELLDRMMSGEPGPPADQPILIPPSRVITRRSSDILAIQDPDLAATVRLINSRACEPLTVPDILDEVPVGRRALERRFKKVLGRTLQAEIMRVRLERARQLLVESDLNHDQIAARCGFPHAPHFGAQFRKSFGITPAAFRKQMR